MWVIWKVKFMIFDYESRLRWYLIKERGLSDFLRSDIKVQIFDLDNMYAGVVPESEI